MFGSGDIRLDYDPIRTGTSDAGEGILGCLFVLIVVNAHLSPLGCELQHDASANPA